MSVERQKGIMEQLRLFEQVGSVNILSLRAMPEALKASGSMATAQGSVLSSETA